ncbi:UDP-2,4-diacetamido-2,4,6-trideoxy-beta-L-altropyranose hydrolase [Selenomonas sputigena]|uniref:UDP-2,4-diacetamido-2,4, 6-trideoxy-beta-L-altropyranose hydrolase n=1 Tax=Selenomonas sputigena TaxID=69823 RepID=A0ABV3X4S0_9FIRM
MLHVIIRVDASTIIGSGHLMRCLTLAQRLRRMGHDVCFFMRAHEGSMEAVVVRQGFSYRMLPTPTHYAGAGYASWLGVKQFEDAADTIAVMGEKGCDLLVVDHYALDHTWEEALRPHVKRIFVIDDLADRVHHCDFLLDANLGAERDGKYAGLLPADCRAFLGISYLLLRQEFYDARHVVEVESESSSSDMTVFVCFGGSDPTNETLRALRILASLPQRFNVHVVVGASNPHRGEVEAFCKMHRWHVYCQIDYVARLMCASDCAIGAGGTMTWERCYLGLPSLVVAVAENQREDAVLHDSMGIIVYAGYFEDITDEEYAKKIVSFLLDEPRRMAVRTAGKSIFGKEQVEMMLREVTASAETWKI